MSGFSRALRLALRFRATFIASIVCAVGVGVMWGGNIGAVLPVMQIVFENRSLHDELERSIAESQAAVAEARKAVTELDSRKHDPQRAKLQASARNALRGAETSLQRWLKVRNYLGDFLPRRPFESLALFIGLLMLGTMIKSVLVIAHQILVARLTSLATLRLRNLFFRRTLAMDVGAFSEDGSGELMSRFTYDLENVSNGMNELFGKLVREPLKMIACLIGAALICWRLLLLSLVLAPLAAWLIRRLAKSLKKANRRAMEEMSAIYNILEETFQGIKVVKAFTMERSERQRFHKSGKNFYNKSMRIARYDSLTRPLTEFMGMLIICMALLAGAWLVLNQQTHLFGVRMCDKPMSYPTLLGFYALLAGVSDPARKLSEVFSKIQRGAAAAERVYQLIDRQPTIVDPPNPKPLPRHHRELVFDNVSFEYTRSNRVLEEINLRVEHGETIAFVGPNGCGKSTLASLIPRFIEAQSGSVRLDGVDVREARLRDLRGQIGLVSQETLLFDDTVFNNIRYGAPNASRDEVIEAARQAHAHRFIEERLENGYETIVGARGGMLSGGQRQRIALARAILRDPAILILDEATSQVDLESEQLIQMVLEKFTRNRTTVLITHRMATLALADRIVVMQAGRILDVGPHADLIRRCDLYRRLYDIQLKEIA